MPKPRASDIAGVDMKWRALRLLWPYVLEYRWRAASALSSLAFAKLATISLPFLLKYMVDDLNGLSHAGLLAMPLLLIVIYGVARFMNVMFAEVRDTMFGRVTERTISRISLQIFEHLHGLDLDFHLNRRTGGLSRDIERGTSGIGFLLRFMIFNILPTLFELAVVIAIFLGKYGAGYAGVIFAALVVYVWFSVVVTERRTKYVR
ncbi:MAG TPA: ABC transporter transmembrane domain-containing protein, partial [Candidatus Acidoferrum sp.]|nr:ABC transporter transmembrane domain-containing protein [Candidatus Acidoferrum sp.]